MFEIFALSTTGLRAGDGNRTRMASLEGWPLRYDYRSNNPDHETLILDSVDRRKRLGTLRALTKEPQLGRFGIRRTLGGAEDRTIVEP